MADNPLGMFGPSSGYAPYMNGYARLHPVGIQVRADMLETVAGFAHINSELLGAIEAVDTEDADSMRWLAALMARRIDEIEEGFSFIDTDELKHDAAGPGDIHAGMPYTTTERGVVR